MHQSMAVIVAAVPVHNQIQARGSNGNADGLSRRPPQAESDMLLAETDDEVAATEDKDPEIIALVQEPGLGSFNLPQAQSNDRVLLEVKIALQQSRARHSTATAISRYA